MSDLSRKAALTISGQTGTILVSVITLWFVLHLCGYAGTWTYLATASVVPIRIGYYLTRGPKPVLTAYVIRKRVWRLVVDEGKICTAFLAVAFIMSWPVDRLAVALFVPINLVGQLALMRVSKSVLAHLVRKQRVSGGGLPRKRVMIIGTGARARRVADMILESPELETELIGFLDYHRTGLWRYRDIPLLGPPDSLAEISSYAQIDALFVATEPEELPLTRVLFDVAEKMGVTVCLMPDIYDHRVAEVKPAYINGLPALVYRKVPENRVTLLMKGAFDKIGALAGLLLTAPVMLAAAVAIKLESKGPMFFKQVRTGLNGKPFRMYKFRTMYEGADLVKAALLARNKMSGPVFKMEDDPRITRVGRSLRRFSVDELPQFINVLKGEMSLVGPRPPLPEEVAGFKPWQRRKLSVKPGVTCLWQVNGRNAIDFDEWIKLDLQYIDNWSLWLDAKIVARTIPAVMKGTGM